MKIAYISGSSALFRNLEAQLRVISFLSSFRNGDFNPFSLLSCLTISFFNCFRDECFRILEGLTDFSHFIPLEVSISVFLCLLFSVNNL